MNKNTIIGFVVIGIIMFGFSWYQTSQAEKLEAERQQEQLQNKIDRAEEALIASVEQEVKAEESATETVDVVVKEIPSYYNDTLLNQARLDADLIPQFDTLSNDLVEIVFTTKGAQPYSVKLKDSRYKAYNPQDPKNPKDLYLVRPGASDYGVLLELSDRVYSKKNNEECLNTKNFAFEIDHDQTSDSVLVMKLPFEGGYIQQKYWLDEGSYMLQNELSFVGINKIIDSRTAFYNTEWKLYVPRLEKGYKNEKQYSKLDYYFTGEKKPEEIARGKDQHERVSTKIEWFAFQQQFFSAIVTPSQQFTSADFSVNYYSEEEYAATGNLMVCKATLSSAFDAGSENVVAPCEFYLGPNDYRTLKGYERNYEKIIPLGGWMVSWFNRLVIIPVFDLLGRFISSYGIVILILTLLIKLILSPLTIKSYKSSAKMQVLKPEIDKLNEKYPKQEDAMKKQQAMMNLYQKAGVSPMGGCLPMLLQMPILFAMFRFFPASIELRQQRFLWAEDLSAYDSIVDFGFNLPLLGDHISLFALLMAGSMFIYSKMSSAQMADGGMPGMKFMSLYLMPIMMFFICNNLSSALSYYYFLSNLVTMGMTWYIRKYVVTEEKVRADMMLAASKPKKKSKWQMRLEEAQKMQEQMRKQQGNRR